MVGRRRGGARTDASASRPFGRRSAGPGVGTIAASLLLGGVGLFWSLPNLHRNPRPVVEVEIREFAFEEAETVVVPGTTIRWVNRDRVPHTTTSADGVWASPLLRPGESFELTFEEEGEYGYHCVPHPFMQATVLVAHRGAGGIHPGALTGRR